MYGKDVEYRGKRAEQNRGAAAQLLGFVSLDLLLYAGIFIHDHHSTTRLLRPSLAHSLTHSQYTN
jgi:hypothetical protein